MTDRDILKLVHAQVRNTEKACAKAETSEEQLQLCGSALEGIRQTLRAALAKGTPPVAVKRNEEIIALAKKQWQKDGVVELDNGATVSEGDDNGAYVQAWVWVDFVDTPLDKKAASYRLRREVR